MMEREIRQGLFPDNVSDPIFLTRTSLKRQTARPRVMKSEKWGQKNGGKSQGRLLHDLMETSAFRRWIQQRDRRQAAVAVRRRESEQD
jgi:hypothetical protein